MLSLCLFLALNPLFYKVERVMGIEPTSKAWEALVLPLNYTRTITGSHCADHQPIVNANPKEPYPANCIRVAS